MKKRAFIASLMALVAAPFVSRKKPSASYDSISLKWYPSPHVRSRIHEIEYNRLVDRMTDRALIDSIAPYIKS